MNKNITEVKTNNKKELSRSRTNIDSVIPKNIEDNKNGTAKE